jgi:hypothetical protein
MKRIYKFLAVALVAFTTPAMATTINLGALDVPGFHLFGNSFEAPGSYKDDFTFTISKNAHATSLFLEVDLASRLNIDVFKIALTGANGLNYIASPAVFGAYDFGILQAGNYTLSVFTNVTAAKSLLNVNLGLGYIGKLILGPGRPTSVPEPGTLALLGLGLLGVTVTSRRRRAGAR